jgi:predicted GIY-YIG superfamily endonuclease
MSTETIVIISLIVLIAIILLAVFLIRAHAKLNKSQFDDKTPEVVEIPADKKKIDALFEFVENQKREQLAKIEEKQLKKLDQKQKLETFKQTREQLKAKLEEIFDAGEWKSLDAILKSADKGGIGIYIIYNKTKNKYYVGQAKALNARIRQHFAVEDITRDFLSGDEIAVKTFSASVLPADYRLDHIEKLGIEIFGENSYNKTHGNL